MENYYFSGQILPYLFECNIHLQDLVMYTESNILIRVVRKKKSEFSDKTVCLDYRLKNIFQNCSLYLQGKKQKQPTLISPVRVFSEDLRAHHSLKLQQQKSADTGFGCFVALFPNSWTTFMLFVY